MAVTLAFRLPWLKLKMRSPLTSKECFEAIAENVDQRGFWSRMSWEQHKAKFFRGTIDGNRFSVVRQIGEWRDDSAGTVIEVRMRMHLLASLFTAVWITGASAGAVAGVVTAMSRVEPFTLLALGFPLFGVLGVGLGFGSEAVIAERLLLETFRATVISEGGSDPGFR
jgi:hypothetical protein